MSIGIGQILVIVVVGVLLFGNFTGVSKDLAEGFNVFQSTLDQKEIDSTVPSEKDHHLQRNLTPKRARKVLDRQTLERFERVCFL